MRRLSTSVLITSITATLVVTLLSVPARAVPGHLDPFFDSDGRQTSFIHGATGYAVAIDKRQRIVVAGYTLTRQTDIALARFLPNGQPDRGFGGGDGRTEFNLGGTDYAFVYLPTGAPVTLRMGRVTGAEVEAWWFNPRTGSATRIGSFTNEGERAFTPPDRGEMLDWVLVLDDESKNYPPPGTRQ